MELTEILKQPDGFTPPDVTVKIEKVYERKSGESDNGPWSFQDLQVTGGRIKLKGLPEFPRAREGQTVTIRANSSKQHGLTGLKVQHELYQGKTYDKLIVTSSAKWDFAANGNGNQTPQGKPELTVERSVGIEGYVDHLISCAGLASQITSILGVGDQAAMQAAFATICIDTKNRGILLPKEIKPVVPINEPVEPVEPEPEHGDAWEPPQNDDRYAQETDETDPF